jgi:hypothetical protein
MTWFTTVVPGLTDSSRTRPPAVRGLFADQQNGRMILNMFKNFDLPLSGSLDWPRADRFAELTQGGGAKLNWSIRNKSIRQLSADRSCPTPVRGQPRTVRVRSVSSSLKLKRP